MFQHHGGPQVRRTALCAMSWWATPMATSASAPNVPRRRQRRGAGGGVAIDGEHEQWPCRASGHMASVTVGFLLANPVASLLGNLHSGGRQPAGPRSTVLGNDLHFSILAMSKHRATPSRGRILHRSCLIKKHRASKYRKADPSSSFSFCFTFFLWELCEGLPVLHESHVYRTSQERSTIFLL